VKSPKEKPTGASLRSRRVAILLGRVHHLGTIEAPDKHAAFGLSEQERARLTIRER
jgi:hypothetical protein